MPRLRISRFGSTSLSTALILALALSACATRPQNQPSVTGALPSGVEHSEECSTLGIMACRAMSMLSGETATERRSTCIAYRTRDGSRVEKCAAVEARVPDTIKERAPTALPQAKASGRNVLSWSDNSNNENNFVIERCDQVNLSDQKTASCAGTWRSLGTVPANVTQYIDDTAIVDHTYLYRVKAINKGGSSGYTNEAVIKTPAR